MIKYLVLVAVAGGISLALTPLVRALARRLGAVDMPGERKIHQTPIPRLGGVVIVLSWLLTVLLVSALSRLSDSIAPLQLDAWMPLLAGAAIVFIAGVVDDLRPIPPWLKFLFQATAALVAIGFGYRLERISLFGGTTFELGVFSLPLTFLWIVGITNAFNLVDGLDGLAAGLASIAAGATSVLLLMRGEVQDAMLLLALLGALLGFLKYNFNPATIFLGDSGSLTIGYILAVITIGGSQKSATTLAVIIPLLVFGLPIIDTLLSMLRRFVGGLGVVQSFKAPLKERILSAKRMFQADQGHIHHRLIAMGFSHRNAVLVLYTLALFLALMALISVISQYRNAGIILVAVGLATYIGLRKLGYQELAFLRTGTLLRWWDQLPFNRLFFLGFVDLIIIAAAYWLAYYLKYSPNWPPEVRDWHVNAFPIVLVFQQVAFYLCGLYRGIWRAAGMGDLIRAGLATTSAVAVSYVLSVIYPPPNAIAPFYCIDFFLLGALVIGTRSSYRILEYARQRENSSGGAALIYGAGRTGQIILRELLQNAKHGLRPVGFLDDNPALRGREINRVPVLGCGNELQRIAEKKPISALVLSSPRINGFRLKEALEVCELRGIAVLEAHLDLVPLLNDRGNYGKGGGNGSSHADVDFKPTHPEQEPEAMVERI